MLKSFIAAPDGGSMLALVRLGNCRLGHDSACASESRLPHDDIYGALDPILEAVATGNTNSFVELYRVSSPLLFRRVLQFIRNGHEAEEILQDVYVKVWERARQFDRRKGRAVGWMLGIARNCALDALLSAKRRPHHHFGPSDAADDPFADIAAPGPAPDDILSAKRRAQAVQSCVAKLSNEQRESLALVYYHGMSQSEISLRLGVPLGTVKSRLRRALRVMEAELLDYR